MLKQLLGFSPSRYAASAALLVVLGACNGAETEPSGFLEVLPNVGEDVACDVAVPGHLKLAGVVHGQAIEVSGDELCKLRVVARELPAGLYSVSWEPESADDDNERWELRGPSIVNVFAGQVTRLRVKQIASDRALLSRTP